MNKEYLNNAARFVFKNADFKCLVVFNNDLKKYELIIKVNKNNEEKSYPPTYYVDLILHGYYLEIDQTNELSKKFTTIYEAKTDILHFIARFNAELIDQTPKVEYDYSQTILLVNTVIEKLKAELDVRKYELEVKKLTNETKWYKEPITIISFAILLLGFVLSIDRCHSKTISAKMQKQGTNISCYNNDRSMFYETPSR